MKKPHQLSTAQETTLVNTFGERKCCFHHNWVLWNNSNQSPNSCLLDSNLIFVAEDDKMPWSSSEDFKLLLPPLEFHLRDIIS